MKNLTPLTLLFGFLVAATVSAADVLVVVDSSGSMRMKTADGVARIDAAKASLLQLTPLLKEQEVGVLLFGHRLGPKESGACQDIELRLPISPLDPASYALTVAALQPRGATPIANSLYKAREILLSRNSDVEKAVVLVTDGNESCGGDPVAAAEMLKKAGIKVKVHVVGFAVTTAQEKQLRAIATKGGGQYVSAKDAAELKQVLPKLINQALRKTKIEQVATRKTEDSFENDELQDWLAIRPDVDRYAAVDGELLIISQHTGDKNDHPGLGDWHDNTKTKNLLQRKVPLQGNDYEVSVDLKFQIAALGQGAALQLRTSDDHLIELSYLAHPYGNNVSRKLAISKIYGKKHASVVQQVGLGASPGMETMTLKIVKRGIVFTGMVRLRDTKTGKMTWVTVGSQAMTGFERAYPTLKASNGWQNKPEATATFDNFVAIESTLRRTVTDSPPENSSYFTTFEDPQTFQEDFEILHPVDTHVGLSHGLNIVSQYGKFGDAKNPVKNIVALNQPLPSGNYEIQVQARTRLTSQNLDVGISLYQDDQTGIYVGQSAFGDGGYNTNPRFHFEKLLNGKRSGTRHGVNYLRGKEVTVIFKITKRGRKYFGSVYAPSPKTGEMKWIDIGEQTILRFKPRLAFYAWNRHPNTYGGGPTHEVNICFEKVTVRSIK